MSTSNFKTLKMSDIDPGYNSRSVEEDLGDIMRSIKEQGLLEPIGVVKDDKRYRIAYGNRRYFACKKLGHKFIDCVIQDYKEEKHEVIANAAENFQRKQLNAYEKGMQVNHLITNYGLTYNEVSASLGISILNIKTYLRMYQDLPKKYKDDIISVKGKINNNHGKITTTLANQILTACKTQNLTQDQKNELLNLAKQGKLRQEGIYKIASKLDKNTKVIDVLKGKAMASASTRIIISDRDYETIKKSGLSCREYLKRIIYGEFAPLKDKNF